MRSLPEDFLPKRSDQRKSNMAPTTPLGVRSPVAGPWSVDLHVEMKNGEIDNSTESRGGKTFSSCFSSLGTLPSHPWRVADQGCGLMMNMLPVIEAEC
jgi:hypothetical protein